MGCSLAELKDIFQDHDENALTHSKVMEWIVQKMRDVERKKDELDQILATLSWMLEYRTTVMQNDAEEDHSLSGLQHLE